MSRACAAELTPGGQTSALLRLSRLAPLDEAAVTALDDATHRMRVESPRREILVESQEITEALLLLSGWAARVRVLADGRRQILGLLLPGDLIGNCRHRQPLAACTVVALTELCLCKAPSAVGLPTLNEAYAISHALEEAYLLAQITRLGRLAAHERIGDLLLELAERLALAGLATGNGFPMPLTQEMLADAMGLTPVHVNRTLQLLRRDGDLIWKGGRAILPDPQGLARKIGRAPCRVSAT